MCKTCGNKAKNGSLKCKICELEIKRADVVSNTADTLIDLVIDDLSKDLKNKYRNAFHLYTGAPF
jgi:hypothetical protein